MKRDPYIQTPRPSPAPQLPTVIGITSRHVQYVVIALVLLFIGGSIRTYMLMRPRPKPPFAVPDKDVQRDVQSALAASTAFAHDKIGVGVLRGTVILTGTVHQAWKQEGAANLAASIPGVMEVKNLIQVREIPEKEEAPWQPATDTPTAKPHSAPVESPEAKAQSLVQDGNWQLKNGHRDAAIKDFQAAMALSPGNYEAQSGLQEAEHMQ